MFGIILLAILLVDTVLYFSTPDEYRHPKTISLLSLWRILPLSGFIVYYKFKRKIKDS